MAHIDEIISFNERAQAAAGQIQLSVDARRELCIVTCVDPRLVRFFPEALGVERGDAVIIRLPGASLLTGHGDGLRAVAAAVYINHAREFVVLGHTDCGTTRVDAAAVSSEMQRRGVSPSSMPGGVRDFLGAIADMRQALKATANAIRSAPYLPRDILVHAAILDLQTGALEIIERGENFQDDPNNISGDPLGYRPGRAGALSTGLGDGMDHLASGSVTSLFDGGSALQASTDPFAGLGGQLPPGWADGGGALSSAPASTGSGDAISSIQPPAESNLSLLAVPIEMSTPIEMSNSAPVANKPSASAPHDHAQLAHVQSGPPPIPNRAKQKRPSKPAPRSPRAAAPAMSPNIAKIRDFYRLEFALEDRRQIGRQLAQAAGQQKPSSELVKIVVKPILDLGQKRYKVIDEVIAVKEQASVLSQQDALALLLQIFD